MSLYISLDGMLEIRLTIDWEWVRTITVCVIALGMIVYLLKELWGMVMALFDFLKLCLGEFFNKK